MKKKWKSYLLGKKGRRLVFSGSLMWLIFLTGIMTVMSCDDDEKIGAEYNPELPVQVSGIEPLTGGIATPVVIKGQNFGTDKTKVQVLFNGKPGVVVNVVNEYIYALVPKCDGGDTEIKVIVGEASEGTLETMKFDYVVSSKVTTIASDYTDLLDNMVGIGIDDQENLVICKTGKVQLYSIEENKMVDILAMEDISLVNGCFSRDYENYYVLPGNPQTAALFILSRRNNWAREMVFYPEEISDELSSMLALTVDDEENILVYGVRRSGGGAIYKIHPESKAVTKVGMITLVNGTDIAFNPKDKWVYMSLQTSDQIIKIDPRQGKETLDYEVLVGRPGGNDGNDGTLSEATIDAPRGLDFDDDNNLYVAAYNNHCIKKIDLDAGLVSTFAGKNDDPGYQDGDAANSLVRMPRDVAVTRDGIVYVMEFLNSTTSGIESVRRLRCVAVQ